MRALRLSDLALLSDSERERQLELFLSKRHDAESQRQSRQELSENIREYEQRYEVSTAEMRRMVASGQMQETAAICSWLMVAEILDSIR